MKLVTADRMRAIDREAIENRGIPGPELMENAGRGIGERVRDEILHDPVDKKVVIFCGKGNNGGDGFVIARYLAGNRTEVAVYLLSKKQ